MTVVPVQLNTTAGRGARREHAEGMEAHRALRAVRDEQDGRVEVALTF